MNQSMMASQKTGEDHELPNSVDAQARNASYNETFDSSQPYKQVHYPKASDNASFYAGKVGDPSFTRSTMSASNQEPVVANVEASMFGSQTKASPHWQMIS